MVILDTNEASLHAEHMESEDKVDSWPDPCSTLQVGSWLTPATNLPKARASGLPACSALRFSHAERQKGNEEKDDQGNAISLKAYSSDDHSGR